MNIGWFGPKGFGWRHSNEYTPSPPSDGGEGRGEEACDFKRADGTSASFPASQSIAPASAARSDGSVLSASLSRNPSDDAAPPRFPEAGHAGSGAIDDSRTATPRYLPLRETLFHGHPVEPPAGGAADWRCRTQPLA